MATEQVVQITESFAGPNFSFSVGEVIRFVGGAVPQTIASNSRPFDGMVPHTARVFSKADWDAANVVRTTPPPPKMLTEDDIRQRFGWTMEQFQTAKGSCGFPVRFGFSLSRSTQEGHRVVEGEEAVERSLWDPVAVDRWETAIRSVTTWRRVR